MTVCFPKSPSRLDLKQTHANSENGDAWWRLSTEVTNWQHHGVLASDSASPPIQNPEWLLGYLLNEKPFDQSIIQSRKSKRWLKIYRPVNAPEKTRHMKQSSNTKQCQTVIWYNMIYEPTHSICLQADWHFWKATLYIEPCTNLKQHMGWNASSNLKSRLTLETVQENHLCIRWKKGKSLAPWNFW